MAIATQRRDRSTLNSLPYATYYITHCGSDNQLSRPPLWNPLSVRDIFLAGSIEYAYLFLCPGGAIAPFLLRVSSLSVPARRAHQQGYGPGFLLVCAASPPGGPFNSSAKRTRMDTVPMPLFLLFPFCSATTWETLPRKLLLKTLGAILLEMSHGRAAQSIKIGQPKENF